MKFINTLSTVKKEMLRFESGCNREPISRVAQAGYMSKVLTHAKNMVDYRSGRLDFTVLPVKAIAVPAGFKRMGLSFRRGIDGVYYPADLRTMFHLSNEVIARKYGDPRRLVYASVKEAKEYLGAVKVASLWQGPTYGVVYRGGFYSPEGLLDDMSEAIAYTMAQFSSDFVEGVYLWMKSVGGTLRGFNSVHFALCHFEKDLSPQEYEQLKRECGIV